MWTETCSCEGLWLTGLELAQDKDAGKELLFESAEKKVFLTAAAGGWSSQNNQRQP